MKKWFKKLSNNRGWSMATMIEVLIAFAFVIIVLSVAIYLNKFV